MLNKDTNPDYDKKPQIQSSQYEYNNHDSQKIYNGRQTHNHQELSFLNQKYLQSKKQSKSKNQFFNLQKNSFSWKWILLIVIIIAIIDVIFLSWIGVENSCFGKQTILNKNQKIQNKYSQQSMEINSFKVRQKFRKNTPQPNIKQDLYDLKFPVDELIQNSKIEVIFDGFSQWKKIKRSQFSRAIKLMEVVHNVNFKGQFQFDHHQFYSSPYQKWLALQKILIEQKNYYQKKYQISKYINNQIGFCVAVTSYNNARKNRLYLRNLDSIFQQQYKNYHLVYTDDNSPDGTGNFVEEYMKVNQIPKQKYIIIKNEVRKTSGANFYNAVHNHCKQGQVVAFIDGDDALIGRQVLSLLNAVYQKQKVALTYGQFLITYKDRLQGGWALEISKQRFQKKDFPRKRKQFVTGHLKTMYVDVYKSVNLKDFQDKNGKFFQYSVDVVMMTPAVQLVGNRSKYLGEAIYQRRYDTGSNEPREQQRKVMAQVFHRPLYKTLTNFSFADNPKTVHYP